MCVCHFSFTYTTGIKWELSLAVFSYYSLSNNALLQLWQTVLIMHPIIFDCDQSNHTYSYTIIYFTINHSVDFPPDITIISFILFNFDILSNLLPFIVLKHANESIPRAMSIRLLSEVSYRLSCRISFVWLYCIEYLKFCQICWKVENFT